MNGSGCPATIPGAVPGVRFPCRLPAGHRGHHDANGVFFAQDVREPVTAPIPSEEQIEAARASKRISDRAARLLARLRNLTTEEIRRAERERRSHADDDADLADLDEAIRACGRDPATIWRLL